MKVRLATINDLGEINSLYDEYSEVKVNRVKITESVTDMIRKGSVLVATDNERMIGCVAGWVLPCGFTDEVMYMAMFFYVKEEYRRYTVMVLRAVEKFIASTECDKIVFASPNIISYEKFNRFYRTQGYVELETHFCKDLKKIKRATYGKAS